MSTMFAAFPSLGTLFDPHKHEAVETEETEEQPEGTVLEEFVRGYKSHDRIIRAARVKVAKALSETFKKNEMDSSLPN